MLKKEKIFTNIFHFSYYHKKRLKVKLFVSGHSHILKVIYDKKLDLLHINPGAAGISGIHKIRTAIRFVVDKDKISNLKILELERYPDK